MSNQAINQQFLAVADANTRSTILGAMAKHYGITQAQALAEVTQPEAEHLLDYLTGSVRTAAHIMMRELGLSK